MNADIKWCWRPRRFRHKFLCVMHASLSWRGNQIRHSRLVKQRFPGKLKETTAGIYVVIPADYYINSLILWRWKEKKCSLFLYYRSISMLEVCFCMKLLAGISTSLLLVFWPSQQCTQSWVGKLSGLVAAYDHMVWDHVAKRDIRNKAISTTLALLRFVVLNLSVRTCLLSIMADFVSCDR